MVDEPVEMKVVEVTYTMVTVPDDWVVAADLLRRLALEVEVGRAVHIERSDDIETGEMIVTLRIPVRTQMALEDNKHEEKKYKRIYGG